MTEPYDSRPDTVAHIDRVRHYIHRIAANLTRRAWVHDGSKLREPEKSVFDEWTPALRTLTYGSPEYEGARAAMGEGLRHHYLVNDHHPEHFADGIDGMNLMQITEMFADWCAAVERHEDGDIRRSIDVNADRFGYGPQLRRILHNTADWIEAQA